MTSLQQAELIVSVTAAAVFLGLAVLTAVRGRRNSTLALPTAVLCADLCAYLSFEVLGNLTDFAIFEWLEASAAGLGGGLLFFLVVGFVGARRTRRRLVIGVLAYFGAIALASLSPLINPAWEDFPGGDVWALLMLAGTVPAFSFAVWLLLRHYHYGGTGEERLRTQLFMASIAVGVGGAASDLTSLAGALSVPRLGGPGMLISAVLLTALALRAKLVTGGLVPSIVTAVVIGLLGVLAQLIVFRALGSTTSAFVVGSALVLLVVTAAARAVWSSYTEVHERRVHLAALGRLSAQMAHDIRNPLAAIRGAAEYLEEEIKRGGESEHLKFITLILEETERLDRVVDEYRRVGRAEPVPKPSDVAALVAKVVDGASLSSPLGVAVSGEPGDVGTIALDAELVTNALENLVRNAIEAFEEAGGRIVVGARIDVTGLELSVTDDGPGMDARTLEKATGDFFTTKAGGSGLGLAFAKRVAESHGGRLLVESRPGTGTRVRMLLPLEQPTTTR